MQLNRIVNVATVLALTSVGVVDAFWRMNCDVVQTGRVDPIVNPGALAAHAHTIVGGNNIGVNATFNTLLNSQCTSCEIGADKSAYWTPLLYYSHPNGSFEEVPHSGSVVYYLSRGPNAEKLTNFPKGFMMLSGDKSLRSFNNATTWGNATYPPRALGEAVTFQCIGPNPIPPEQYGLMNTTFVNSCTGGLRAQIHFQTCWNGKDLYKADNSHVAHLSYIDNGVCPPGYPYQLPHIFLETLYSVSQVSNNQNGGFYVFSQGDPTGYGFHGDFQNGWDLDVLNVAMRNCIQDEGEGLIQDCPILMQSQNAQFGYNCPERPAQVQEPVHGMLDKLPGCIKITNGPAPAAASDMNCPASVKPAQILRSNYGNPYNKYLGCANDTYGSQLRTLNAISTTDASGMTVESCQNYCSTRGYRYSGVEYGQECHCDLVINPTALLNFTDQNTCNMQCPGNRSETCGGQFYMSVYNNTDPAFVATNDTFGSAYQLTVKPAAYSSDYVGCVKEGSSGRALPGFNTNIANMTIGACKDFCTVTNNYAYYGLEYGSQCYCGNSITNGGAVVDKQPGIAGSSCTMHCAGNFSQVCGDAGMLSVYNNTAYKPAAVQQSVGKYRQKACLTEGTSGRALQGASTVDAKMTVDMCVKYCLGKKMNYAGVEYGQECYCGKNIVSTSGAKPTSCPAESQMTCAGNRYQYCGGSGFLNLYYSETL
ncbi:hypothetical protein H2203_000027 [Taxawa tesnikishii (nom. ined.)]|nr:hypothetical protein H2203_000027 [Dothideales sp. JES 119]